MNSRATPIRYDESPRLRRIRLLARLMDQSIVLPGGYRIGLDPIIGLVPGIGDLVGAAFSFYIIYESARLGLSNRVLGRMCGNVFMELLISEIPILGDIFDAVWKANMRNFRLVELHHNPAQPERSGRNIVWGILFIFLIAAALSLAIFLGLVWLFLKLFKSFSAN